MWNNQKKQKMFSPMLSIQTYYHFKQWFDLYAKPPQIIGNSVAWSTIKTKKKIRNDGSLWG